ncbi:MAG: hypothetical protein D6723_09445 [Acidobacteria bacterium]|nr:MAG: hypothetical protein D6723_09445 [Acidobacteriota bacterium]
MLVIRRNQIPRVIPLALSPALVVGFGIALPGVHGRARCVFPPPPGSEIVHRSTSTPGNPVPGGSRGRSPSSERDQRIPRHPPKRSGALQVRVRDSAGAPLPSVRLRLEEVRSSKVYEGASDGDGIFRFLNLPPGRYLLQALKPGFQPVGPSNVEIAAGEIVALSLTLSPSPMEAERPHRLPRRRDMRVPSIPVPTGEETKTVPARQLPRRSPPLVIEKPALLPADVLMAPALKDPPIGFTGSGSRPRDGRVGDDFIPIHDRWRIGFPEWDRGTGYPAPYHRGHPSDPYNQNVLKADYPIIGNDIFALLTGSSETLVDFRRVYTPSLVSAADPSSERFFGRGEQVFLRQNVELTFELFRGNTAFKPQDWAFRITPVFNINYLNARENGVVNIDVRRGTNRRDGHVGFQEFFAEVKLADSPPGFLGFFRGLLGREKSPYYDFTSLRVGIQKFNSDFRGFIFREQNLGYRLFGNNTNNLYQWNLAYFTLLEKDTNSELNTVFDARHHDVIIFNLYRQDFIWKGYTIQGSLHYSDDHAGNRDEGGVHFNTNGFLERPAPVGGFRPHNLNIVYLGFAGDGHIGRLNLSHAFYQALGEDDFNPIANRRVDVNARMLAVEASVDRDWIRFKGSFFWASGDGDPTDGEARGFDAIFDDPVFAGGEFSFWNGRGIRLTGTGIGLVQPRSVLPSLRTSKTEGQANFVNPGLFLFNLGADVEVMPELRALINVNVLRFQHTAPLELLLFQSPIRHHIGTDCSIGIQYRPLLNNNVIIKGGISALIPGRGFRDLFTSQALYSAFVSTKFTF